MFGIPRLVLISAVPLQLGPSEEHQHRELIREKQRGHPSTRLWGGYV